MLVASQLSLGAHPALGSRGDLSPGGQGWGTPGEQRARLFWGEEKGFLGAGDRCGGGP